MNLFFDIPHQTIDGELEYFRAELIAFPEKEVGGTLEYEDNPNALYDKYIYISCEKHGIKYKNKKYTEDQKKSIYDFMQQNWQMIESEFIREFSKNEEND